jgi:hypothetical protein
MKILRLLHLRTLYDTEVVAVAIYQEAVGEIGIFGTA